MYPYDRIVTLALFDVDGTLLLSDDPVANRALLDVLDPSLPDDAVSKLDHKGRTALWIAKQLLGREPDGDWCARYEARYAELLGDTSDWRTPDGAVEILGALERRGVQLALLTGNAERIARLRMGRLGLARFFPQGQGAFGCESEDRDELMRRALERARVRAPNAVEIGDTPRDESSARALGVRSIRVDELRSFSELLELVP